MAVMSGLSGNEIYCLAKKGYSPGELVIGNSVFSMGFLGSLSALGSNIVGGENCSVLARRGGWNQGDVEVVYAWRDSRFDKFGI